MWGFAEVPKLCIKMMSTFDMTPVDKILLGNKYHVLAWLKEGYHAMVTNVDAMTVEKLKEHVAVLGWEKMAKVLRLRDPSTRCAKSKCSTHEHGTTVESVYCKCCGVYDVTCYSYRARNIGEEIRKEFLEEFLESEAGGTT